MCKQPVLAFYCSRPLIYEGPHIGFQFHEGNSEFNSEESNSDSNSNSNDGNSNSIPIPPGLSKANSNSIPELDLELARKSNSGAELTPTLIITRWHNCIQDHQIACVAWTSRSLRALLTLRIVTHVTSLLKLRLLTPYCDNCIQDRCKISFHLCDTSLVEGEISLPMLPLHYFESMVKMFTLSLLTLHKTTSNIAGNVYSLSKQIH